MTRIFTTKTGQRAEVIQNPNDWSQYGIRALGDGKIDGRTFVGWFQSKEEANEFVDENLV